MRKRGQVTVDEWNAVRDGNTVENAQQKNRQFLAKLGRSLSVLSYFTDSNMYLSNEEIASRLSISKPTSLRILSTLTILGFLAYVDEKMAYKLGPSVLTIAHPLLNTKGFSMHIRPQLHELAIELGARVSLAAPADRMMMYLDTFRSNNPVVLNLTVGSTIPIPSTAAGRAYLASLSEQERGSLLLEIEKYEGSKAIGEKDSILQSIDDLTTLGYCTSLGEWHPEVNAIAVPLKVPGTNDLLVIACGGPSNTLTTLKIRKTAGPRLVDVARALTSGAYLFNNDQGLQFSERHYEDN